MPALAFALALVLLVTGSAASAQTVPAPTTPDPQALVGEWAGVATRIAARAGAARGTYMLTIEKVEGGKVYGRSMGCAGPERTTTTTSSASTRSRRSDQLRPTSGPKRATNSGSLRLAALASDASMSGSSKSSGLSRIMYAHSV